MRKSKDQIKNIGRVAVVGLIIAVLLEFRTFYFVEKVILQRVIFLRGHRDFVVNILIGCSCSAIVVIVCEYFEYLRLNKTLQNQIDSKLRGLKTCLEAIDGPKCLEELVQFRNENLEEYKRGNVLKEEYSPFRRDPDVKEYSHKLYVLNKGVWDIFFAELDISLHSDQKKYKEYIKLVEQKPKGGSELVDWKMKVSEAKKGVENSEKFHEKEIYNNIKKLKKEIGEILN